MGINSHYSKLIFSLLLCFNISYSQDRELLNLSSDSLAVLHVVSKGDNLYRIAKKYGVNQENLYTLNDKKPTDLNIGDSIFVPVTLENISYNCEINNNNPKGETINLYYKVRHGETLFHIAKRILNLSPNCLMSMNNLSGQDLRAGQKLVIGKLRQNTESTIAETGVEVHYGLSLEEEYWSYSKTKSAQMITGPAMISKHSGNQPMIVLFDDARNGDVLALYNPINKKSCYARVVGKIPSKKKSEARIIVSKTVQEALGMKEQRFNLQIEYFK